MTGNEATEVLVAFFTPYTTPKIRISTKGASALTHENRSRWPIIKLDEVVTKKDPALSARKLPSLIRQSHHGGGGRIARNYRFLPSSASCREGSRAG